MKIGNEIIDQQKLVFRSDINRCRKTICVSSVFSANIVDEVFYGQIFGELIPERYFLLIEDIFVCITQGFPDIWKRLKSTAHSCSYGNNLFAMCFYQGDLSKKCEWYFSLFSMDIVVSYVVCIERSECSKSNVEGDIFFWIFYL